MNKNIDEKILDFLNEAEKKKQKKISHQDL